MVFGVMTGEATEAGTKSLGAGDTRTQERVKSLRWREKKKKKKFNQRAGHEKGLKKIKVGLPTVHRNAVTSGQSKLKRFMLLLMS